MTEASTGVEPSPADSRPDLARGAKRRRARSDRVYWGVLYGAATIFALVCLTFLITIVLQSSSAWGHSGIGLITGRKWDPSTGHYGALPLILGTLLTTFLALLFAVPIGIAVALAIVHLVPSRLRTPFSSLVELLAAVPSVIYGIVGVLVLVPYCQSNLYPWLASHTGNFFLFSNVTSGFSVGLAGIVLFVMVLPTVMALSRDAIASVPQEQIEGALSVGATRWQTLYRVVLPNAKTGIIGAVTLAAARALGETIAVSMVVGGAFGIGRSFFDQGNTMAAAIASGWDDSTALTKSAFCALAIILIAITASVNYLGRRMLSRSAKGSML